MGLRATASHNDMIGPVLNPFDTIEFFQKTHHSPICNTINGFDEVDGLGGMLRELCTLMFTVLYSMLNLQSFLVVRNRHLSRNIPRIVCHGS